MTKKVFNEEDRVLPAELPAHEMPGLIPRTDCVGAMELRQQIENSHGELFGNQFLLAAHCVDEELVGTHTPDCPALDEQYVIALQKEVRDVFAD